MLLLLSLLALQDPDWPTLLKRLDSQEPEVRDTASRDLRAASRTDRPAARKRLSGALDGASPETRARIRTELDWLAAVDACADYTSPLAPITPDPRGRSFALFNTGDLRLDRNPEYLIAAGWLVEDSKDSVLLLEADLDSVRHRRLPKPRHDCVRQPDGAPDPGTSKVVPFADYADALAESWTSSGGAWEPDNYPADELRLVTLAHWALTLGHEESAMKLEARAREVLPGKVHVADAVLTHLRRAALLATAAGEDRPALIRRWEFLKRLGDKYADARLAELRAQTELLKESSDAADRLIDARGRIYIVPSGGWDELTFEAGHEEILKAGWASIPSLIERFDSTTPTRVVREWGRVRGPSRLELVSLGLVCRALFHEYTGHGHAWHYELVASEARIAKDKALAWWKRVSGPGAEAWFLSQLDHGSESNAARRLMQLDPDKHLVPLLERVLDGHAGHPVGILDAIGPRLSRDHALSLEKLIPKGDLTLATACARLARERGGSTDAARRLLARLDGIAIKDNFSEIDRVFVVLAESGQSEIVDAVVAFMDPAKPLHWFALRHAELFADERVAKRLFQLIDGDRPDDPVRNWYDLAVDSAVELLGYPDEWWWLRRVEGREKQVAALKQWWKATGPKADWAEIRARAAKRLGEKRGR